MEQAELGKGGLGTDGPSSIPTAAEIVQEPPPDSGIRAWMQIVAGHLIVALTWGYGSSFGVFQTHYEHTLPRSASAISWIG